MENRGLPTLDTPLKRWDHSTLHAHHRVMYHDALRLAGTGGPFVEQALVPVEDRPVRWLGWLVGGLLLSVFAWCALRYLS